MQHQSPLSRFGFGQPNESSPAIAAFESSNTSAPSEPPVSDQPTASHSTDSAEHPSQHPTRKKQKPPVRKTIAKKVPRGRQVSTRGSGFCQGEVENLLNIINDKLPLCAEEWTAVLREHIEVFPHTDRTVDSIRRKFATLHRKKMPTGDPLMPADVKFAKRIRYAMRDRADLGGGDEADGSEFFPNEAMEVAESAGLTDTDVVGVGQTVSGSSVPDATPSVAGMLMNSSTEDIEELQTAEAMPRPLVHRRSGSRQKKEEGEDIMAILKAQVIQDGLRREEEHKRREEDRQVREEERREDRVRRADEVRRHEQLMQMMMTMVCKGSMGDDKDTS